MRKGTCTYIRFHFPIAIRANFILRLNSYQLFRNHWLYDFQDNYY